MSQVNQSGKLAVLIDADNAQPSMSNYILAEVAKYGTIFVRRAYGDWTGPLPTRRWNFTTHPTVENVQVVAVPFLHFCQFTNLVLESLVSIFN